MKLFQPVCKHTAKPCQKVGLRWGEGGLKDLLDYGELPEKENCEISRWELGTLNYASLVRALNEAGVRCTHGNHYAVSLVDEALASPQVEWRRIMFCQVVKTIHTSYAIWDFSL